MPIAKRSAPVEGHSGSSSAQATSAFATNPVTGDTILVIVATGNTVTHNAPTDPAGNVYTQIGTQLSDGAASFPANLSFWRKENCTGFAGAVTGNTGALAALTVIAWCFQGANTPTSYNADANQATNTGSANPASGTSSPAPAANSFFVAATTGSSASAAVSAGSGWEFVAGSTQTDNTTFQDLYTEELTSAATSSSAQNGQFTAVSAAWAARVVSFAPVPSAAFVLKPQHRPFPFAPGSAWR